MRPGRRVVYLVRHGRTALNAEGRLRGHRDPPLDDVGRREVADLGRAFASLTWRPVLLVSGPLLRTRETALAIGRSCGLDVEFEPRLIDRDYGPWTGEPAEEVRERFGRALEALPGAEPLETVAERAGAVLDAQVEHVPRGPVVLVAHDVVNGQLLASLDPDLGPASSVRQDTACWNAIELTTSGCCVQAVNGDAASLRFVSDHVPDDADE